MMHITMWSQFVQGCFWPLPSDRSQIFASYFDLFLLDAWFFSLNEIDGRYSSWLGFYFSGYWCWFCFSSNNQAVQDFYHIMVKKTYGSNPLTSMIPRSSKLLARRNLLAFDDGAVVVITETDLDGYDSSLDSRVAGSEIWADLNLIYRVRVAGGAALARLLYVVTLPHWPEDSKSETYSREQAGGKLYRRYTCFLSS